MLLKKTEHLWKNKKQSNSMMCHGLMQYSVWVTLSTAMLRLLAQLSVDGKHLWMTDKGKRQDGDGVRRLHKQQQQRLHLKSPCTKHWMIKCHLQ